MDENAIRTILAILNRKNDVEIKRTGDGYVIIEVEKKRRYRATERLRSSDGKNEKLKNAPACEGRRERAV